MKPTIFFYVQHLLGVGHQMRAGLLARAMVSAGFDVHYVSGGFNEMARPINGVTFHQLAPIRSSDAGFSSLVGENNNIVDDTYWSTRMTQMQKIVTAIKPNAYLIEGFPFARRKFSQEILTLLEGAKTQKTPVFCSVRDILVPPSSEAKSNLAIERAKHYFTKILIHGDENFIPLTASLPSIKGISAKLYYTGYVAPEPIKATRLKEGEIIVSAGGGAVGETLLQTALKVALKKACPTQVWRFLLGPNLPNVCVNALKKHQSNSIIIEAARPDFQKLLAKSKLSISQAGYNTVMDLMVTKTPSVLVPFGKNRESEQPMRANLLEKHQLSVILKETELNPQTLSDAIEAALLLPTIDTVPFQLDGSKKSARYIKTYLTNRGA